MIAALRLLWQQRSPREQSILAAGGLALTLLLFLALVILPLHDRHRALQQRLPGLRTETAQLEASAAEVARLRAAGLGAGPSAAAGPFDTGASLRAAGLFGSDDSVQTNPDGTVQVELGQVNFDAFVDWVGRSTGGTLVVSRLTSDALDTPGMVHLKVQLRPVAPARPGP